jgi:hypothetical protein
VAPTLTADRGALEKVVIALMGCVVRRAPVVVAGFSAVEGFSCWKKAIAECEGKVLLGVGRSGGTRQKSHPSLWSPPLIWSI